MPPATLIATPAAFAVAFSVSRETREKLECYAELLRHWQKTINLVAPSTLDDLWHRHFADSAQLVGLATDILTGPGPTTATASARPAVNLKTGVIPEFSAGAQSGTNSNAMGRGEVGSGDKPRDGSGAPLRWLDLGSGAGFPGLVVAIMLAGRPGTRVTLIESDQRKAAFLREVARQTGAPVDILSIRIESATTQFNFAVLEVLTARALAPLGRLLQLTQPFFGPGTLGLFLTGCDVDREIAQAREHWRFECELRSSLTEEAARIAIVRAVVANSKE